MIKFYSQEILKKSEIESFSKIHKIYSSREKVLKLAKKRGKIAKYKYLGFKLEPVACYQVDVYLAFKSVEFEIFHFFVLLPVLMTREISHLQTFYH